MGRGQVLSVRAGFPPVMRMQKEAEEPRQEERHACVVVWKPSEEIEPRKRWRPTQWDVAESIDHVSSILWGRFSGMIRS